MKKKLLILSIGIISAITINYGYNTLKPNQDLSCCLAEVATCKGSSSCKACKNCKYCKHCSISGNSCGVCD